jgi:hypothetical protein
MSHVGAEQLLLALQQQRMAGWSKADPWQKAHSDSVQSQWQIRSTVS